jgi:hypothetical protein
MERKAGITSEGKGKVDVLLFLAPALVGVFPGQVFVTWGTRISLASMLPC